jgi:serine O-acetyltransferase
MEEPAPFPGGVAQQCLASGGAEGGTIGPIHLGGIAMAERIQAIEEHLRALRKKSDAISEAARESLPYTRRIADTLVALGALVTDRTPTEQLSGDLQVVHGLVAALIGTAKSSQLIERLPEIRRRLVTDVEAAYEKDPAANSYGQIIASYPSLLAVSVYRIAHVFYELDEPVVARAMSEDAHSRTGIDINPGAKIGDSFFIDHGTGVVIGETCHLGDGVKLYHGVTLGAFSNKAGRADAGKKRHPTLEVEVTVCPNATILGGNTVVGMGAVIGGNVWLTKSVPPYARVKIGDPDLEVHQTPPPPFGEGI